MNGRNTISWEKKFDRDVEYIDHITFLGDWKIIFKTVLLVFVGEKKFLRPVTEAQYAALKREIKINYSSNDIICAELKLQASGK